jgi:phage baseplate assembly protein W
MTQHLGTGVAFPIALDSSGRVALARDEVDVEQAIRIILSTVPGERPMRPEFGCAVHECTFANIDALTLERVDNAVRAALDRWEPRVETDSVDFDLSHVEDGELRAVIGYRVRATNSARNLVHPFYVIPAEESLIAPEESR